jgi:hypothetical protein
MAHRLLTTTIMMSSWWLMWMVFMFLLFVPPLGYGWGYRGWGPPYPRYLQRRRTQQATAGGAAGPFRHESWGWGGDFVWIVFFVGFVWVVAALLLPVWSR